MTILKTLGDLGEFKVITDIIRPALDSHGLDSSSLDDCSYHQVSSGILSVSADAGPKPLLQNLSEFRNDFYSAGWLAAIATISDIATSGAKPLFITNCIEAPSNMRVDHFRELVHGFFEAVSFYGFRNGGGDVRQSDRLKLHVFGAGHISGSQKIGRSGASPGDLVVLLGDAGSVMASYLLAKNGIELSSEDLSRLRFPKPQFRQMISLTEESLIVACSDTSDGLIGAMDNICKESRCGISLNLSHDFLKENVVQAAILEKLDPWNIFFCWGDWSLVSIVKKENYSKFESVCSAKDIDYQLLGSTTDAIGKIEAHLSSKLQTVKKVRNENFIEHGFNSNFEGHLDYMLRTKIFEE